MHAKETQMEVFVFVVVVERDSVCWSHDQRRIGIMHEEGY
jgi:hypothetical protein